MNSKPEEEFEEGSLASLFLRYMQNPCLPALHKAEMGVREPLAKYIEEGGKLGDDTRVWLAKFLRGEAPALKRGNKRTEAQILADAKLLMTIRRLQEEYGLSEYAARKKYVDENENLNDETVKSQIRRAKKDPEVWGMIQFQNRHHPRDGS